MWVADVAAGEEVWTEVPPMALQYPAKACLFHFAPSAAARESPALIAAVRRAERREDGRDARAAGRLVGWAQWHDDPLAETGGGGPAGAAAFPAVAGPWGWLAAALRPVRVKLPPGHAAVSRISTDLGAWAPLLPLDFSVASGSTAPWGLRAVFAAADRGGQDVRVAALGAAAGSTLGWAAESAPGVFAPRFTPGRAAAAAMALAAGEVPLTLVFSSPAAELEVEVRANVWAALAR